MKRFQFSAVIFVLVGLCVTTEINLTWALSEAVHLSECFGEQVSEQFVIFEDSIAGARGNFFEAQLLCASFESGTVARVLSEDEHTRIAEILETIQLNQNYWIGLNDPLSVNDTESLNTERFVFVDGFTGSREFIDQPGQFPWDIDEPNNTPSQQDCVIWERRGSAAPFIFHTWSDKNCFETRGVICRTACQVAEPVDDVNDSGDDEGDNDVTQNNTGDGFLDNETAQTTFFGLAITAIILAVVVGLLALRPRQNVHRNKSDDLILANTRPKYGV